MTRQVSKPNIFWAPSLETARKIDDEDTVQSIETARYRFTASMADLERCYDEEDVTPLRTDFPKSIRFRKVPRMKRDLEDPAPSPERLDVVAPRQASEEQATHKEQNSCDQQQ